MSAMPADKQSTVLKEEEPDPSAELVELRQKVAHLQQRNDKLEDKYACSVRAIEAERDRVQFLENIIDKKPELIENSKKMNEMNQKVIDLTSDLKEERRQSITQKEKIDELTAEVAQYEKNKTLLDRLVTDTGIKTVVDALVMNTGIPEDSFPEEIMSQAVEFDIFQMQNTMVDDNSGEAEENEERMEVDEQEELLTDLVVGLFEGERMDERKIQEMITLMETTEKQKIAKSILEGLAKIKPEYIAYLASTLTPSTRQTPSTVAPRGITGGSNEKKDRQVPSLESQLVTLLVEVYKGKHTEEASNQLMRAHMYHMQATTIAECVLKAARKFPKRRNPIRKRRSEADLPLDLSPRRAWSDDDMDMDMNAPPHYSPAASVAVSTVDGEERGTKSVSLSEAVSSWDLFPNEGSMDMDETAPPHYSPVPSSPAASVAVSTVDEEESVASVKAEKLGVAKEAKKEDEPEKNVDELCQELVDILENNPNVAQWRHAMKIIHSMFSKREEYPIDEMINFGLVPYLVQGLSIDDEEIQYSCVMVLAIIVHNRDEETNKIVELGAVSPVIGLMTSSNYDLAREATWIVMKIAYESEQLFGVVLQSDVVETLTTLCGKLKDLPISFVRMIAGTFSYCRWHMVSQVSLEVLDVIVQSVVRLLKFEDCVVSKRALTTLEAITYHIDTNFAKRMLDRDSDILPIVFKYFNGDDDHLLAVTVLTNIADCDESLKQSVIDLGTLQVLPLIMENMAEYSDYSMHCCQLIGNVIEGNAHQKQAVIDNGLLKMIVTFMKTGDTDCQGVCSEALAILAKDGTTAQILSLIDEKPIPALAVVLTHTEHKCISNALRIIRKLLSTSNSTHVDTLKKEAEEAGVVDHLKNLQNHSDEEVRSLASEIFSEYFAENDGEEGNEKLEKTKVQKRKREVDEENSDGAKKGKASSDEKKEKKKKD